MSRYLMLIVSLGLVVSGPVMAGRAAQDEKPAETAKPAPAQDKPEAPAQDKSDAKPQDDNAAKPETGEATAKPDDTKATELPAAAAPALKPVPPEVEAKLEEARRAVAEAIVAAEDAGLIDTTINPPPVLDILLFGQANDRAVLKAKLDELKANPKASPEAGLSVEVFGAWFSGQGAMEGVDLTKNVRIMNPSKGLMNWYARRAEVLNRHIAEARKARDAAGAPPAPEDAAKTKDAPPATSDDESKPVGESKKSETAPADEAKKDETKPAGEPTDEKKESEAEGEKDTKPEGESKPE